MNKIKLKIEDQINHMKKEKGILFNITSEEDAVKFLVYNNYYFKIKAYAKNYEKYKGGKKKDKYINLEFAYLQELSKIDMHLRKFIIKMTLDIEHFAKLKLMRDLSNNELENGYDIVEELFQKYPYIKNNIESKCNKNSISKDLIEKYRDKFSAWNIIEVLSFGDFINLYKIYYDKYTSEEQLISNLWSVKCLRNAAAHNSCLINSLKTPYTGRNIKVNKQINTYISKIDTIKPDERKKKMKNPIMHDFVVTLYVFNRIITSKNVKMQTINELKELVNIRFVRNKHYFDKNQIIKSYYRFIKKIIDYFY